jgi:hypothetical protein
MVRLNMFSEDFWTRLAEKGKFLFYLTMVFCFIVIGTLYCFLMYPLVGLRLEFILITLFFYIFLGLFAASNAWLGHLLKRILSDPDCKVDRKKYKI